MSLENLQENHEFTSKDVVGVFLCLGALVLVALNALAMVNTDLKGEGAEHEMVRLGRQLALHGANISSEEAPDESLEDFRAPAAVDSQKALESLGMEGTISEDPWGEAYSYRFFSSGDKVYGVAIWSKGPNRRQDLSEKNFLAPASGRVVRILSAGDDLSHIELIR